METLLQPQEESGPFMSGYLRAQAAVTDQRVHPKRPQVTSFAGTSIADVTIGESLACL